MLVIAKLDHLTRSSPSDERRACWLPKRTGQALQGMQKRCAAWPSG
jgi:hypothetical protein